MINLPYDICLRLREAGLPHPKPEFGQIWFDFEGQVSFYDKETGEGGCLLGDFIDTAIFCPDAQYLLDHLPTGCTLYRTSDGYTLKHNYHQMDFNTYKGESLAHAAANAYLHLHEKTPAP